MKALLFTFESKVLKCSQQLVIIMHLLDIEVKGDLTNSLSANVNI